MSLSYTLAPCLRLLAFAALLAPTAQAESLLDIYRQAQNNDHSFKAAQAAYAATRENKNLGRAGLLPSINASASWSDTTTDSDNAFLEQDAVTTSYGVSLEQSLLDVSAWKNYQQGSRVAKAAQAQLGTATQSLIIRTATAYFDALEAVDNYKTAIAEEKALASQLDQVKQRYEVGLTAITEVHEAQAAYDSVLAVRLQAEGELGIRFDALEVLTGRPYSQLAPLREGFKAQEPQPAARESWVETAQANNYALKAARFSAEAARFNAQAQKAAHLPTITASASYSDSEIDGESFSANGPVNTVFERESQEVSISLRLPIFNGGSVSARRRQAYQEYIEQEENYKQTKRSITQDARARHLSVMTSAATVRARAQAIVSNQSALDATQAGYDVGTRDFVDVLNAQRNLYRAQRDYFTAVYDHVLNELRLQETAGTLDEEDVAALDRQLQQDAQVSRFLNIEGNSD